MFHPLLTRRCFCALPDGFAALALLGILSATHASAVEVRQWAAAPYRVNAMLAVDDSAHPRPGLETAIARHIAERVDAVIAPFWKFELQQPPDAAARRFCRQPVELPPEQLPNYVEAADKQMWLYVVAAPAGYDIQCREFDLYMQRWGVVHRRRIVQSSFLAEACFEILRDAFSPLAIIESIPDNNEQVHLTFKGSSLPVGDSASFVSPAQAFLPLFRRTDRQGSLVAGGVRPIPWTLLTTEKADGERWVAEIHTGTRRPFGVKPSAVLEILAVGLRNPPGPTTIRFHSRNNQKLGLAGYDVYRELADGETKLLGVTDSDGVFSATIDDAPLATLLLRTEGQLLAKLPVAAGTGERLEIPIADNPVRLRAQAESRVIREQLIDVVARRAILVGRVRAALKSGNVDAAQKFMAELDTLPSRSNFSRDLDALAERTAKTEDPTVQQSIDKLFSATRDLLSKFLDPRQITELQNEVNAAKPAAAPEPTAATASN